jgi:hypothetical protein
VEVLHGVQESHFGAVEAHHGTIEIHRSAQKAHLATVETTLAQCGSPWHRFSPWWPLP